MILTSAFFRSKASRWSAWTSITSLGSRWTRSSSGSAELRPPATAAARTAATDAGTANPNRSKRSSTTVTSPKAWWVSPSANSRVVEAVLTACHSTKPLLFCPWKTRLTLNQGKDVLLGQLWLEMLRFYTLEFALEDYIISIRLKELLSREMKNWPRRRLAIEGRRYKSDVKFISRYFVIIFM